MSSDSDEEFRSLQRIERIARKHVEQGTWVLDGNSTSDEEFIENYATEHDGIDELISEFNNQRRELKDSMPPEFKISKLVEADGPRSRNEIERLIKEYEVDINSVQSYSKTSGKDPKPIEPIFLSIKSGPMYKMLKKYGIKNVPGLNGETLLHRACRNGYKPVVKLLLQDGITPLFTEEGNRILSEAEDRSDASSESDRDFDTITDSDNIQLQTDADAIIDFSDSDPFSEGGTF